MEEANSKCKPTLVIHRKRQIKEAQGLSGQHAVRTGASRHPSCFCAEARFSPPLFLTLTSPHRTVHT
ncbi:hypothetical protein DUNSADRAFT_14607 [Dunaliella salina]|uniref:Encoded protein n=1 Tax=Dunaliella salina TaxID=3046 RepID=A0ABQ7H2G1_DUNSA|nr:hypothetical protein DUNSADRAFT_14607 [Dunaliella salina]|eukprot:KAF5841049.1 hypothetical protein DUNSADRAFT_14607 [Dunaliella salina]